MHVHVQVSYSYMYRSCMSILSEFSCSAIHMYICDDCLEWANGVGFFLFLSFFKFLCASACYPHILNLIAIVQARLFDKTDMYMYMYSQLP